MADAKSIEINGIEINLKDAKARTDIETVKENQINLIEDDTSMEGISDSVHDTLTTTNKKIIPAINEVSDKLKDIAKKTIVEGNKIYLAKNDGTKLDEGTDLPTSSGEKGDPGTSVTISSIVESTEDGGNNVVTFSDGSILNVKNGNKGNDGTSGSGRNAIETYKTENIGELYAHDKNYNAWSMGMQYDKSINKFVHILTSTTAHAGHTEDWLSMIKIDPNTFEVERTSLNDLLGIATTVNKAICNFNILNDGTYLIIAIKDGVNHKFTSTNNGKTWTDNGACTGNTSNHFWSIWKISNNRLIGMCDSAKKGIYYSDDLGASWTNVIPNNNTIGDYVAEGCFIELETNKIMCIARKNMSGTGYSSNGDSDKAIISYSTDNGTTWSAWVESNTIDDMNASCCNFIKHDNVIELFVCSRWWHYGNYSCTNYNNTGKAGAINHYVATVENAKNDNFTKVGIIDYAKTTNSTDYHAPALAVDNNGNMLLAHMDIGDSVTCAIKYIRGGLGYIEYACSDDSNSKIKPFSAFYTNKKITELTDKVGTLQYALSKINGSGVTPPSGTYLLTNKYIPSDMYASGVYPWQEGSDFYQKSVAQYDTKTGDGQTHCFLDTNNDGIYETLKTYCLCIKENLDSTVNDSYMVLKLNTVGKFYMHIIKDGYITVLDRPGASKIYDYKLESIGLTELKANSEIELHDGYCIIDTIKYQLPKIALSEYVALNNAGLPYHKAITNLKNTQVTSGDITDSNSQMGIYIAQYMQIEGIKIYKKFS